MKIASLLLLVAVPTLGTLLLLRNYAEREQAVFARQVSTDRAAAVAAEAERIAADRELSRLRGAEDQADLSALASDTTQP